MKLIKAASLFFAFLLCASASQAQKSIQDSSISMGFISIVYNGSLPAGDFAKRFGYTSQIGAEGGFKLANNFYGYTGLKFLFGNDIRESVARNVVSVFYNASSGLTTMALGADGRYYSVRFFERGYTVPLVVGKIFALSKRNKNSGLYVELGTQFIQHKIWISAIGDNVPYLSKPYVKGYDRLTNGLGLVEGVGYRHFGTNRLTNFFIGVDLSQNFTKNRRDLNVDTGIRDDTKRMDLLFGMKVGWCFPIYQTAPEKEYYN
jgi:hypothetical protein